MAAETKATETRAETRDAEVTPVRMYLRTIPQLTEAHEWLFAEQRAGRIDAKSADAMNTTLKGSVYLNGKLKIEAAKLWLTATIKKLEIPRGMLPPMGGLDEEPGSGVLAKR